MIAAFYLAEELTRRVTAMNNIPIPEEFEKRIIEKIKKLNPGELPSHKTQIEREIELYRRGYTDGYTFGYLVAQIKVQPIDRDKGIINVSEIPGQSKNTK